MGGTGGGGSVVVQEVAKTRVSITSRKYCLQNKSLVVIGSLVVGNILEVIEPLVVENILEVIKSFMVNGHLY